MWTGTRQYWCNSVGTLKSTKVSTSSWHGYVAATFSVDDGSTVSIVPTWLAMWPWQTQINNIGDIRWYMQHFNSEQTDQWRLVLEQNWFQNLIISKTILTVMYSMSVFSHNPLCLAAWWDYGRCIPSAWPNQTNLQNLFWQIHAATFSLRQTDFHSS